MGCASMRCGRSSLERGEDKPSSGSYRPPFFCISFGVLLMVGSISASVFGFSWVVGRYMQCNGWNGYTEYRNGVYLMLDSMVYDWVLFLVGWRSD